MLSHFRRALKFHLTSESLLLNTLNTAAISFFNHIKTCRSWWAEITPTASQNVFVINLRWRPTVQTRKWLLDVVFTAVEKALIRGNVWNSYKEPNSHVICCWAACTNSFTLLYSFVLVWSMWSCNLFEIKAVLCACAVGLKVKSVWNQSKS